MEQGPRPPGGDRTRGTTLLAISWTEAVICIIIVAVRFWARSIIKALGKDDWIMMITLILFLLTVAIETFGATHKYERHLFYLNPSQIVGALKVNWAVQPPAIMAIASGKISVSFLLLRILGPSNVWQKMFIYVNMVFIFIVNALTVIFTFAQCNPPRALWEGQQNIPGAKCWDPASQSDFSIFSQSYNAFVDICLALLPATFIWTLALSKAQKVGVSVLLGLGILSGVCAAIKASKLRDLNARADLTWQIYDLYVWTIGEIFVIIICGSIPTFKPIYDSVLERSQLHFSAHKSQATGNSSNSYSSGKERRNMKRTYQRHLGDTLNVPGVAIGAGTKSQANSVGPTDKHTERDRLDPFNDEDAVELVGQKNLNVVHGFDGLHAETSAREDYDSIPRPLETAYMNDRDYGFSVHRDMERSDNIV